MNRLGLIGYPLGHSVSAAMQSAALREMGLVDWSYENLETPYEELDGTIGRLARAFRGFNVTIPYKEKILPWLGEIDTAARAAGAVNTVRVDDGVLWGTNTDGLGYLASLKDRGIDPSGMDVLILGSGGAARGVGAALITAGVSRVTVASRQRERGMRLQKVLEALGGTAHWVDMGRLERMGLGSHHLIVNATPVGMSPKDRDTLPLPYHQLTRNQILSDLVYRPRVTGFLQEGIRRGLLTVDGTGMLLHQGALAFSLWTGLEEPPLEVMAEALLDALDKG